MNLTILLFSEVERLDPKPLVHRTTSRAISREQAQAPQTSGLGSSRSTSSQ
jgi:hypothetical protein